MGPGRPCPQLYQWYKSFLFISAFVKSMWREFPRSDASQDKSPCWNRVPSSGIRQGNLGCSEPKTERDLQCSSKSGDFV